MPKGKIVAKRGFDLTQDELKRYNELRVKALTQQIPVGSIMNKLIRDYLATEQKTSEYMGFCLNCNSQVAGFSPKETCMKEAREHKHEKPTHTIFVGQEIELSDER